jgi:hypothetical protein
LAQAEAVFFGGTVLAPEGQQHQPTQDRNTPQPQPFGGAIGIVQPTGLNGKGRQENQQSVDQA